MDTLAWTEWNEATGREKERLMAALCKNKKALTIHLADRFLKSLRLTRNHMYADDVHQAARLGIFLAIQKWEPCRGSFLTCAWGWTRLEMQKVMGHACPISYPRSLLFDGGFQQQIAVFYAQNGRDPTPDELGISARKRSAFARVSPKFGPLPEDVNNDPDGPRDPLHDRQVPPSYAPHDEAAELEEDNQKEADLRHLRTFLVTLAPRERQAFLAGKRPALMTRAKVYVQAKRG